MVGPGAGVTVRHMTRDDVEQAAHAFRTSLGAPPPKDEDVERYARYWDVEHSLVGVDGVGRVLGVAATFAASLTVEGGAAVPCAAVPSVGVRPDSHGMGVGRALLEQQVLEARDRDAAVLALNASEVAIYGRYGYGPTSRWWSVRTDARQLGWREDAPRAAAGSVEEVHDPAEVRELLPALHERAFGRWAGELSRPDGWWWAMTSPRADERPATFAVHRDQTGRVDASLAFRVETAFDDTGFANKAVVRDSVATDPAAEALLWRWLLERNLLGPLEAERTNPRSPLPWMLVEPRRLVTTGDGDAAWVRVVDVPRVLGARTTTGRGRVVVRVVDPLVAANDRTWELVGEDGRLTVEPSDDEPEVTLPVDLLAPLAWGYARLASLVAAGRVGPVRPAAVHRLEELLATRAPAWCSTGF